MSTSTSTTTERLTDMTWSDVLDDLTGHEEKAIEARFGLGIGDLLAKSFSMARRALICTLYSRQDNGPKDPYKAAMDLRVSQLDGCFAEDDDEDDGLPGNERTEPSEAGKDGQHDDETPVS